MMAKVFVSLPMNGLKDKYVQERREKIFRIFEQEGDELIDTLEPVIDTGVAKEPRLVYLGRAITRISDADVVIFAPDWRNANGCRIEHAVCELYNIPYVNMSEEWNI